MHTTLCGTMQDHPPQKLSKPLTNTSSSSLLAPVQQSQEPVSPSTSFDADGTDHYFSKMAGNGERRKRRDTIRSYLYGPSPESGHSLSSEDEESNPRKLANVARDAKRRPSRTESYLSQNLNAGGASAASSTSRLASSTDLSEDDLIKEQIKEKVWIDTLAAQNHVSSPIDEDKHPDSVKSPIRRRSLYTPGIATRSPEDILRKPPPPEHLKSQADRDYYYNPALPDSSPLSRLAGLQSPQNGRSTPSELDYGHLGTLKLGTLRVTNGTVSPIPREQYDIAASTSVPYATSQNGSYTPFEGGRSEEDVHLTRGDLAEDTPHLLRDDLQGTSVSAAETPSNSAAQPFQRSSLYGHYDQRGSRTASITSVQSLTMIKRKPVPEPSAAVQLQRDRARSGTIHPSRVYVNHPPLTNAVGLEHNMPTSQTSSNNQSENSNLCPWGSPQREPESWRSFIPGANQTRANDGSREDAFQKLTRNQSGQEESNDAAGTSQTPFQDFSRNNHHADSGYSSNVSLESTQWIASKPDLETRTPSQNPAHIPQSSSRLLSIPYGTKPSRCPQGSDRVREEEASISAAPLMLDKSTDSAVSESLERSSLAIDTMRGSATSSQKQLSSPEKSRRLQKKRPKSQPPMQRTPKSANDDQRNSDVPPLPSSVAALHYERVSKFPLVDHYSESPHPKTEQTPTFPTSTDDQTHSPSSNHRSEAPQLEERPSIFQKMASKARSRSRSRPRPRKEQIADDSDNESAKSDICRSPSWSEYGNTKKKQQRKKEKDDRELEKLESTTGPDSRSRSRSRSRFRRRSRPRSSQREAVPTLTDFGTVRESLGARPYDIALAGRASNRSSVGKQLQPYQVSTSKQGMDPHDALPLRPRERNRQRSQTSATMPLSKVVQASEDVPSKPTRPYSMYIDQRPVPAMPMADLAQRNAISRRTTDLSLVRNAQMVTNVDQAPPQTLNLVSKEGPEAESERKTEFQCTSTGVPPAETSVSMEALIDRLLDATSPEARELTLEQIRQKRRETSTNRCKETDKDIVSQETVEARHISQDDANVIVGQNTSLATSTRAWPSLPNPEGSRANRLEANEHIRHDSLFIDAPPMPPVPSTANIQQQEARKSMGRSAQTKTLDRPQIQASKTAKGDLWAGCAIQTEHRKAIESRPPSSEWDAHRLAWSHRRRSAGEALSQKYQPPGLVSARVSDDVGREPAQPPIVSRTQTEQLSKPSNNLKVFHKPWAPSQEQDPGQVHSMVPLQANSNVVAAGQMFERRSGRYEGGLLYGYEPGFGLGGSAGTRSTKTGATRKSLQISQGFGVDLSDVPIFVAPSK
ncbi:MAG: hypothetical protein Q9186_005821 [Xanthomendoza sp. 1 TL-2023]